MADTLERGTALVRELLQRCGRPVLGHRLSKDELDRAVHEGRVVEISAWSSMGDSSASFSFCTSWGLTSTGAIFPGYLVFPAPIPVELRALRGEGWEEASELREAFGITGDDHPSSRPIPIARPRTFGSEALLAWRAGDAILVFRGPHRDVVPAPPQRADGRPVGVSGEFWLVRKGRVERKFVPRTTSIEDELDCDLPAISDAALYGLHLVARGPNLEITEELLVPGLQAIGNPEVKGLQEVLDAFEQDAQGQRDEAARKEAQGAARVASVDGGSTPLEDPALEAARVCLVRRLAAWPDELCRTLLELLLATARLEPRPLVAWIAEPFALACRHAVYDASAPKTLAVAAVPPVAGQLASAEALRANLERAKTELEQAAEFAEYSDSHDMRARFSRAASLVGQALARLAAAQ